jgi:hypothetical protein
LAYGYLTYAAEYWSGLVLRHGSPRAEG